MLGIRLMVIEYVWRQADEAYPADLIGIDALPRGVKLAVAIPPDAIQLVSVPEVQAPHRPAAVQPAADPDAQRGSARRLRDVKSLARGDAFGGERRLVEFPRGKPISLPRAGKCSDETAAPHGRSAPHRTRPRNRCVSGAELKVRIHLPPPASRSHRCPPRAQASAWANASSRCRAALIPGIVSRS